MTKIQVRNLITKFHFYLLGFCLLIFLVKSTVGFSLNHGLSYFLKILLYTSGIILFIWYFRPFKKVAIYFGIYAITPILTFFFWAFGGILSGILASIVLYPIYPNNIKVENEKVVIYTKHQGFLGACCSYEVFEKKYFLFEKKMTEIKLSELSEIKSELISAENGTTQWKITHKKYNDETDKFIESDTIIPIRTE